MMIKQINLYFADPEVSIKNHFADIDKAIKHASHNLYSRHKIEILPSVKLEDNHVTFEMTGDIDSNFCFGRHLRGISIYLLKCCSYPYKEHCIGTRLLFYTSND